MPNRASTRPGPAVSPWLATSATARVGLLGLGLVAGLGGAACGGRPPAAAKAPPPADGGGSPPGAGLAPLPSVAPPGVKGSDLAPLTIVDGAATCARTPPAASAEATLEARVAACGSVTGARADGAPLTGELGEDDPATEHVVTLPARTCGRVLLAHDRDVRRATVTLLDERGATAADGASPAVPEEGVLCAGEQPARLVLRVAVGGGRGRWAARLVTR